MALNKTKYTYIIIGAGPSGLGAGLKLLHSGIEDFIIIEKDKVPGGLSKTITTPQGFRFDIGGGHVLFNTAPGFQHYQFMYKTSKKDLNKHDRIAKIMMPEKVIDYPFQTNFHKLGPLIVEQILHELGAIHKQKARDYSLDFYEYMINNYGQTICDLFMIPYNKKVWRVHPNKMDTSWIDIRVAPLDFKEVLSNISNPQPASKWGPNKTFYYPDNGIGTFFEFFADILKDHILYDTEINKIDPNNKRILSYSPQKSCYFEYENLISSIPLPEYSRLLKSGPGISTFKEQIPKLKYTSLISALVPTTNKGPIPKPFHWMYFPGKEPPYRITKLSSYGKGMSNKDYDTYLFEIAFGSNIHFLGSNCNKRNMSKTTVMDYASNYFFRDGYKELEALMDRITPNPIVKSMINIHYSKYSYPVPIINRDLILQSVHKYLNVRDIYPIGRFGSWRYEQGNMDHSFMDGQFTANKLIS